MAWDYPVFLDLTGRRCLVIGNGFATQEKVRGLVRASADVTLLASGGAPEIATVKHIARDYREGDLAGFFLAISTHEDKRLNETIWREALERGVLFNAVDDPPHCGFAFPSIHRQGDLAIAISTNGKCPALAVRLREIFEREIGPEYAEFLEMTGRIRGEMAVTIPDFAERKQQWYRIVDEWLHG